MTTAIALSAAELAELASCETVIEHGLKVFQAVGVALITIREKRLYRAEFATFEAYCAARWGFTDERARLLMRGAEVAENIAKTPTMVGVLPASERQVRPLIGLTPDQQRAAWQQAVETAPNGKITGAHVEQVAQQYKPMPVHRPAAVRPATEGVEPDLDEDGEPLVDHVNRNINDRLADQVDRDDEDEDEGFHLGDIVEYRGHRCNIIAVSSSGRISVKTPIGQPLHGIDPDVEVVTLIERAPARSVAPRLPVLVPPAKPTERLIPVVDGMKISESHPVGFDGLYATDEAIGYGKATCSACGTTSNGWTPIPAGQWKCRCGETTNDDQMQIVGKDEYDLDQRVTKSRQKPKTNYAAPASGVDQRDLCQTPPYAIDPLLPYISSALHVWEPAYGEGLLTEALYDSGFKTVITGDIQTGENFFEYTPDAWDVIVTNPPFSLKYRWLERCYALGKPFALLMPLEVLGAKSAQVLFRQHGINVIFLSDRVDFKMPNLGWDGSGAQFPVAWFCWGLEIPEQMTFADIEEAKRAFKAEVAS